jgi:Holliday junction resolvase RusA-like endonuclease
MGVRAVEVILPPSTNHLFATVRGRRVKSREYRDWQRATAFAFKALEPAEVYPVGVTLTVLGKVYAQRDLDNFMKPVLDMLVTCGIVTNDTIKYVTRVTVQRGDAAGDGRVRIELTGGD